MSDIGNKLEEPVKQPTACIDEAAAKNLRMDYLFSKLPAAGQAAFETHLKKCAYCSTTTREIIAFSKSLASNPELKQAFMSGVQLGFEKAAKETFKD